MKLAECVLMVAESGPEWLSKYPKVKLLMDKAIDSMQNDPSNDNCVALSDEVADAADTAGLTADQKQELVDYIGSLQEE